MMFIDTGVIDAYLRHEMPSEDAWFYDKVGGYHPVDAHRQEVCAYLSEALRQYRQFPIWNRTLILSLLPNLSQITDTVSIMPIIASDTNFDAGIVTHEGKPYLLIDLLHIADYTSSVKQMCYILHNLCHMHLLRYALTQTIKQPSDFQAYLRYRFFSEGWILYLSWNEDYQHYALHSATYTTRKKRAFALMDAALQVEEDTIRQTILHTLKHADLWDRFCDVAGMFFCDSVYRTQQTQGLIAYFNQGMHDFT